MQPCVSEDFTLQDSEAGQMAAPDELAREEADLRAQREEGAKKAFKVGPTASQQRVTPLFAQ